MLALGACPALASGLDGGLHGGLDGDRAQPRFQTAFDQWLRDEEEAGLRALSSLAADGNRAARLLLGLVDATAHLQGPWLTLASRDLRVALMRAPGGLSGRNWLEVMKDDLPLAGLLHAHFQATLDLSVPRALAAMGEDRATRAALKAIATRHSAPLDPALAGTAWFPTTALHLLRDWRETPAILARLTAGDPRLDWPGQPVTDPQRDAWLATAPEAEPLRALCATQCPTGPAACLRAGMTGLGNYAALSRLGSPAAALLDDDSFASSARGQAALARLMLLGQGTRMRAALLRKVAVQDACLGSWLAAQAKRFDRPIQPAPPAPQ